MIYNVPSFAYFSLAFTNAKRCIEFLTAESVLPVRSVCICGGQMKPVTGKFRMLRCGNWRCRRSCSRTKNTFFSSKLPPQTLLMIVYHWLLGSTYTVIKQWTGCSSSTICGWFNLLNYVVQLHLEMQRHMIGGPGVIVEIDESKFGKRKYHRGHRVEGVWVVGGVERTPERRLFAVAVMDRRAPTLEALIRRYVHPGSIIITDCWKGYRTAALNRMGMEHFTVNHSRGFVNPETGADTNTIEGTWCGMKQVIPKRYRNWKFISGHLAKFVWRRQYAHCLWEAMIEAMQWWARDMEPNPDEDEEQEREEEEEEHPGSDESIDSVSDDSESDLSDSDDDSTVAAGWDAELYFLY